MKQLLMMASVLVLMACGAPEATAPNDTAPSDTAFSEISPSQTATQAMNKAADMTTTMHVMNGEFRAPFPGRDVSAAFLTLHNTGPADTLLGIATSVSDRVELHTHLEEEGIMKMRRIESIDIPANGLVELKPGGLHVMIFESAVPVDATEVDMTLTFAKADPQTVTLPIAGRGDGEDNTTDRSNH